MGDFRIGSVAPADKCRDQEPSDSSKRKKAKRPEGQDSEPTEDYFSPSTEDDETRDSTLNP